MLLFITSNENPSKILFTSIGNKREKDISKIEDKILVMYAKGISTRDIASHIEEIYRFQASPKLISNITDKIMTITKEWQNRPSESISPFI